VRLEELNHLHERLSPEEREELLQCLLIAAPNGGEAMVKVLENALLCHATEELLMEHSSSGCEGGGVSVDHTSRRSRARKVSKGETTQPGYRNRNAQVVIRGTGLQGTDRGQYVYVLRCESCQIEYGANGSDIWDRKCPKCQGGRPGLDFE
jgi:hypothetical protein